MDDFVLNRWQLNSKEYQRKYCWQIVLKEFSNTHNFVGRLSSAEINTVKMICCARNEHDHLLLFLTRAKRAQKFSDIAKYPATVILTWLLFCRTMRTPWHVFQNSKSLLFFNSKWKFHKRVKVCAHHDVFLKILNRYCFSIQNEVFKNVSKCAHTGTRFSKF